VRFCGTSRIVAISQSTADQERNDKTEQSPPAHLGPHIDAASAGTTAPRGKPIPAVRKQSQTVNEAEREGVGNVRHIAGEEILDRE